MAKYLVSFRLEDDATYSDRYQALNEAMDANGTGFWDGGTSLVAMDSKLLIMGLGAKLKAAIRPSTDFLFIRVIDSKSTAYAGEPGEGFLYFFPDAKKL